ncbi:MAG TPA: cytochrome c [Thermomicrobiales bacterium]|nr:cytochrome c [Thermomicrobiales bacterium]
MKKTYRHLVVMLCVATALLVVFAPRFGSAQGTPVAESSPAAAGLIAEGEEIYNTTCIACHRAGGEGVEGVPGSAPTINGAIPALAGNAFVTLDDPKPAVLTVLNGRGGMPRFGGAYSDEQIAAVLSYVRQAFGNDAGPVSPDLVAEAREESSAAPLPATPIPDATPGGIQGLGD